MAERMTQTQVVRHLAEQAEVTNKDARQFLDNLVQLAIQQTKKNGIFVLPGLGRMKKTQRKARMGRNPATGEPIKISAKTTVKFALAKSVKDAIAPPKAKK
jgi:DNA-binding protein HU-beta